MEIGEKMLTYVNLVEQLAYSLQSMKLTVDEKETVMSVLNGLPPLF